MKLDRNTNKDGRGKYALVQMRKVQELITAGSLPSTHETLAHKQARAVKSALAVLSDAGVLSYGNETPGDQFFVMKYKDQFTHHALSAYAKEVCMEAARRAGEPERDGFRELLEYGEQMVAEANAAKELGNRIPN